MGGWTVLAAATAMPNDYKSMVLEGSSTGKPFAADGTPGWPRNVALVFAQYDEFSNLLWGVDLARQANLTLIGRAKGNRFTALSGVERVIFDSNPVAIDEAGQAPA